nr:ROK family protein [uncultured Pedobacter sp.]
MGNDSVKLGADIGGSHITTALVNLSDEQILENTLVRVKVNSDGSAAEILDQWTIAIKNTLQKYHGKVSHFGIAMPGPFDYENGSSKIKGVAKYDSLYDLNIKDELAARLAVNSSQIKMANDAGCFLLGEVRFGSAKGFNHVIGLTLGTGLGTSRFHNGVLEDANLWCMPFNEGIAEDYISTRWFTKRFNELTGNDIKDVKALSVIYMTQPVVRQIFDEFSLNLARFIQEFIKRESPEAVIIGGNIAKIYHYFKPIIDHYFNKEKIHTSIYTSFLSENAALMGASSLWKQESSLNLA